LGGGPEGKIHVTRGTGGSYYPPALKKYIEKEERVISLENQAKNPPQGGAFPLLLRRVPHKKLLGKKEWEKKPARVPRKAKNR